jgi:hypothetical protein
MRRILIALLASSVAVLVVPAAASAHHHRHHGRASAHRHHRHAHMVVIAPAAPKPATETTPTIEEPTATVASFEGGVLKITLPDGSTVSGKVTEETWIGCGCSHDFQGGSPGGFQHDGPSWQNDQGDDNNDQGDVHHDDESGPAQSEECGVSSLVPGAKVKEAELSVSGAGAVWEKVELYPKA